MDTKSPLTIFNSEVISYLWVIGVSLWGGLVSYFEKREKFDWLNLFAHLMSSSFAGLLTFWLCTYTNAPGPLTGVFCGIAAHMGTPALLKMKIVRQFLDKEFDKDGK